jgi:hypothetical protein
LKIGHPSSRASVEEGAIRGTRLTFLLAATGATAQLEHDLNMSELRMLEFDGPL